MNARNRQGPPTAQQLALLSAMSELWHAGRYSDAARLYDRSPDRTLEATIMRARAYLQHDDAPATIALLEPTPKGNDALSGCRAMVLAQAYAQIGNYDLADLLFDDAAAIALQLSDAALDANVAYYRAVRFLFERSTNAARELLPRIRALPTAGGQLRALYLESRIFDQEARHRDQARVIIELLTRIDPNSEEHMEIRAWSTSTLAILAREIYIPEACSQIERQLGGVEWPADFNERRFQALRAVGWAYALRGDYFNAFRFLRQCSKYATSDAWRAIAAAQRAELARCRREPTWSRQELAEAEEYAASVDWGTIRDDARLGLLLLSELFVPIDAARAAYYRAQFSEHENICAPHFYRDDPRLTALAQYSSAIVDLATGHEKLGIALLRKCLATFQAHEYEWRAGRAAMRLFETTRDPAFLVTASEQLRHYGNSWLGDELRSLSKPRVVLPPMQRRVYEALCRGLSNADIARELGRSEFTIRNHIKLIFKAFGVNSRAELIARFAPLRELTPG